MQFTTALVLAVAFLGANALPAPNDQSGQGGSGGQPNNQNQCPSSQTSMCCNNGIGGLALNCVLSSLISGGCQDQNLCCNNYGNGGTVTCNQQDGTYIDIPVNVLSW